MLNMNKLFILLMIGFYLTSGHAEIKTPYAIGPNQLEFGKGYCENKKNEEKFWSSIHAFADSVKKTIPNIPPEQKAYLDAEFKSGNTTRALNVSKNDFFKIQQTITSTDNILELSRLYLSNHNVLNLATKMEIIGRTLSNTLDTPFEWGDIDRLASDLNRKSYYVDSSDLRGYLIGIMSIKQAIPFHLICYGENSRK